MNYNKPEQNLQGDALQAGKRGASFERKAGTHRRGLFLLLDVFLLVAVVAAIFFLVLLLTPLDLFGGAGDEQRSITYTVEFAGVDSDSVEALRVGDAVTDAATGSVIGVVVAVNSRPYEVYTDIPTEEADETLQSHVVTKNTYPDSFNTVTVTVQVIADYVEGEGYLAEDCRIAVGREYDLRFPAYAGNGVCVTFESIQGGDAK